MYLSIEQFCTLKRAIELLPSGAAYNELSADAQAIIVNADAVLLDLLRQRKTANRKTAEYIAEKRKTNKNYARSKR